MRLGGMGRYAAVVTAVGLLALGQAWGAQAGKSPVKVFILAEQSNMEGQGVAYLEGKDYNQGRGTLNFLTAESRQRAPLQKHRPGWCRSCAMTVATPGTSATMRCMPLLRRGYCKGMDWIGTAKDVQPH
jgi:hypothetical protein